MKYQHLFATLCVLAGTTRAAWPVPSQLHVEGSRVVNERGQNVRLTGVNIPSLEWSNEGEHVLESVNAACDNWGANVLRLPLAQDRWFGFAANQDDGGAAYRKLVNDVVQAASAKNVYVVLDLHWSNAGVWGKNVAQHSMPDDNSQAFWLDVATRYADNPAVLFDLYNEPKDVSWEVWKNGGDVTENIDNKPFTYHSPGMQKLVSVIRASGAKNLLVAGGLDWGYDLSGVLKGFALDDKNGRGILYGAHIYPWKGTQPENWNPHVGDIAKVHPVFVGEVGCEPDAKQEAPEVWAPKILKYLDDNGLHWAGWTFHPGASPRMLQDWSYAPTPFWGAFAKSALLNAAKLRPTTATPAQAATSPDSKQTRTVLRDEFATFDEKLWHRNGPWANGSVFDAGWKPENAMVKNNQLRLQITNAKFDDQTPHTAGEVGSHKHYGYGRYEVRMKPAKCPGVISSFFTFINKPSHHEIDIEFTGDNTRTMDMTYYTDGVAHDPGKGKIELPFDASEAFHVYAFEWRKDSITWFVDGKAIYKTTPQDGAIPNLPGEIMMNAWPTRNADAWSGKFKYPGAPVEAVYDWVKWTPLEPKS